MGNIGQLMAHRKLAINVGISEEQILIPDRGDVVEVQSDKITIAERFLQGMYL